MSSIVNRCYPDNFKPVYFFFFDKKILHAQKHVTPRSLPLLIYDHLWESVFLSLYENKQTYESIII